MLDFFKLLTFICFCMLLCACFRSNEVDYDLNTACFCFDEVLRSTKNIKEAELENLKQSLKTELSQKLSICMNRKKDEQAHHFKMQDVEHEQRPSIKKQLKSIKQKCPQIFDLIDLKELINEN